MIDIQNAIKEYNKYIKDYNIQNKRIALKVVHMLKVKEIAKNIAISLNLPEEDIKLAELVGLLHDIGRFEQIKRYNTFIDKNSVNHGAFGAQLLFENGLIRNFIEDNSYDEIIEKAIINHNKDFIEQGLSDKELLHAKIIRDADKIDIFRVILAEKVETIYETDHIEKETFTPKIFTDFINSKKIVYSEKKTHADLAICHFQYVFDLNFKYSYECINKNKYIDEIYKRIKFEDKETQRQWDLVYSLTKKQLHKK